MKTSDFDYNLPMERIAQKPVEPRDSSRMMVLKRADPPSLLRASAWRKKIKNKHFYDLPEFLEKGDLLVWNNSKVFKARLFGELLNFDGKQLFEHKKKIEIFLVRPMENKGVWKVLARPGKHVQNGMRVRFAPDFACEIMLKEDDGTILAQFSDDEESVREKANKYGQAPLPPYIKDEKHELEAYQTVYAKHEGSVAAPTAGFHFTPELIQKLKDKGVEFAEVTLHVGLGTFLPVKSERVEDHTMHSEWVELTEENAEKINLAKKQGRRIIAVGTTAARALEGIARFSLPLSGGSRRGSAEAENMHSSLKFTTTNITEKDPAPPSPGRGAGIQAYTGDINLFIRPGFKFKVIDGLITNFHLPKSTLLMLVSAFAGNRKFMLKCYKKAVKKKYRFYSFGDGMIII